MMRAEAPDLLLTAASSKGAPPAVGRTLLMLFRWGVFLLACGFLYDQLIDIKGTQAVDGLRALWHHGQGLPLLVLMLIGMVLNWTVESVKWRVLMRPVERIDAWRAFLGTIAGTSLALVTPNRTGEFIGRVLFLRPEARVAGAFATALGSMWGQQLRRLASSLSGARWV